MDTFDKFITGVVAIAMVTAFALNAKGLTTLVSQVSTSSAGLIGTAEKG
jgi:hypothetical protein